MPARVPTSRAYWNLRAEQVMDNVFDRETVTDSGAVISRNGQRQTLSVGGLF